MSNDEELQMNSENIIEDFEQYVESIRNGTRDFEVDQCEDKNKPTFLEYVDSYIAWLKRYGCDYADDSLYYMVLLGNQYFDELLKLGCEEFIKGEVKYKN